MLEVRGTEEGGREERSERWLGRLRGRHGEWRGGGKR